MKAKGCQIIVIVVLMNILRTQTQVDDSNEEAQPNYEYIQIFRSIPALFEYLLDALEDRPEILEKNDVTMFNRNFDGVEMDSDESENSDNENKMDKRHADCDSTKVIDKPGGSNVLKQRDTNTSKDVSETTVAYEYGNSNVDMKGLDEIGSNKVIAKRFANSDDFHNLADKEEINRKRNNIINRKKGIELSKLDDDTNDMLWSYGDVFLGFEYLFGLDLNPEEIEERILTAEKLLEEHNNKKEENKEIK